MMSLLCAFGDWLNNLGNVILFGVALVFIFFVMYIMSKNEGSRKILLLIISLGIIISGVYCGINCYKEITSTSYIQGSLDVKNEYVVETFNYSVSNITLYNDIYSDDPTLYERSVDTAKVDGFNGATKKYIITFNDYVLIEQPVISAGAVYFELPYEFRDTYNQVLCTSIMCVSVRFLSNKTTLNVSCQGSDEAQYLQQYFNDYGFRLNIKENNK